MPHLEMHDSESNSDRYAGTVTLNKVEKDAIAEETAFLRKEALSKYIILMSYNYGAGGGAHLGVVRSIMQHKPGGDRLTWGSHEQLTFSVLELEQMSERIARAAVAEFISNPILPNIGEPLPGRQKAELEGLASFISKISQRLESYFSWPGRDKEFCAKIETLSGRKLEKKNEI